MNNQGSLDMKWKIEAKTNIRKELEESGIRQRAEDNFNETIIEIFKQNKDNISSMNQEHSAVKMNRQKELLKTKIWSQQLNNQQKSWNIKLNIYLPRSKPKF